MLLVLLLFAVKRKNRKLQNDAVFLKLIFFFDTIEDLETVFERQLLAYIQTNLTNVSASAHLGGSICFCYYDQNTPCILLNLRSFNSLFIN